jgi:Methyltransferase domain
VYRLRRAAREISEAFRHLMGFESPAHSSQDHVKSFLPLKQTLEQAKQARLSVGDYIDSEYHVPGTTQGTVEEMAKSGVLHGGIRTICEIGPGSGRYLERVLRLCKPESYEIYETAKEWSDWLVAVYHVTARKPDGLSLRHTPSGSIDLAHAHRVFVNLDFVVAFQYFQEMIRVTKSGGYIVFDIVSEPCMQEADIHKWAAKRIYYPRVMPRQMILSFFANRNCSLHSSFFAPLLVSRSEYLVFLKGRGPTSEN